MNARTILRAGRVARKLAPWVLLVARWTPAGRAVRVARATAVALGVAGALAPTVVRLVRST